MQNEPAAVGPVSQPDYFELFGVARRFGLDRSALEKKFYELSRQNHPDRFTQAGPEAQRQALETMSRLNEAYRTLKDPALLRSYLLEICGVQVASETARGIPQGLPMDLAEDWFEVQDEVMEGSPSALDRVSQVEQRILELQAASVRSIESLETRADTTEVERETVLKEISQEIRAQSYLKSMLRDVARMKSKLSNVGT